MTSQDAMVVARHDYLPFGEEIGANVAGCNSQWGPGNELGACEGMISSHIDNSLGLANIVGRDGINDLALTFFAEAGHTLSDLGSPSHSGADGTPTVWGLTPDQWGHDLSHVWGERDESVDWFGIGQSYRNEAAGWAKAFPEAKQPNVQAAIERDVSAYYRSKGGKSNAVQEDASRQCALGNRAACS